MQDAGEVKWRTIYVHSFSVAVWFAYLRQQKMKHEKMYN